MAGAISPLSTASIARLSQTTPAATRYALPVMVCDPAPVPGAGRSQLKPIQDGAASSTRCVIPPSPPNLCEGDSRPELVRQGRECSRVIAQLRYPQLRPFNTPGLAQIETVYKRIDHSHWMVLRNQFIQ
jgi:hypothetical protein